MPSMDKTGPSGQGALTGRGLGFCRRGFGWRVRAEPLTFTKEQEKKILEAELAEVEAEKAELEKQLKTLKA